MLNRESPSKLPSFGQKPAQAKQDPNKNELKPLLKPESNQKIFYSFKGSSTETQYLYVPVAFVIQTDIEHHDVFKEILKSLFESIHDNEMVQERCQGSKELAYAEFLTHVAFLASIPCPTFNTRFHIQFFGKTLTLTEPRYNEVPNKNQFCIKALFDSLDVRTILYCWKALLLDHKLVLISSKYSLQFHVAQALLQLLFPLAYQYSYIGPVDADKVDMVCTPSKILITCSDSIQGYEYFEALNEEFTEPAEKIAICDIDSSFTNNLPMPELENEIIFLKELSMIVKRRRYLTDYVYEEQPSAQNSQEDEQNFTAEIRQVFFGILNQFLGVLKNEECFRKIEDERDFKFQLYFNKEEYLMWFDGTKNLKFAERLIESMNFVTFCDDWQSKEFGNVLIYLNMEAQGFNFADMDPNFDQRFDLKVSQIEGKLREQQDGKGDQKKTKD